MEYKHTKTGAVITTPCVIAGGDWVLVGSEEETVIETVMGEVEDTNLEGGVNEDSEEESLEDDEVYRSITVPQIKQELDAFGIEYDPKAKKRELYDLMLAQGE